MVEMVMGVKFIVLNWFLFKFVGFKICKLYWVKG